MPVTHQFVSGIADGGDATLVRPSDWNADHVLILTVTSTAISLLLDATHELVLCTAGAGGITITLPTAVGIDGTTYRIKRVDAGAGTVTINADGTETIDADLTYLLTNQWQYVNIVSDGANWVVVGNN